ncbi:MAG: HesA/MoeB/ThiF family protein [Synergistaceae bacterium]|nr:HesA/MoeB/ThiF family protein [Synergistaceae bacterium]
MKSIMPNSRYEKNIGTIGIDGQSKLSGCCAAVIGCGGLGGSIIELLARAGIGGLIVVDGDVFSESNLNRQLLCTEDNIGQNKSEAAARRVAQVNSNVKVKSVALFLNEENAHEILSGCDIVFDALDNIRSRLILCGAARVRNIPVVHGAVAGWYGQVSVITPDNRLLPDIWEKQSNEGIETDLGVPTFAPTIIASLQVSEGIKHLIGKNTLSCNSLLYVDMLENRIDRINL